MVVAIGVIGGINENNESSTNSDSGNSVVQSGEDTNNDTIDNKTDSNKITVTDFSTMSEAGSVTDFVCEYAIASGGPYCDCGYKRKNV